MLKKIMEFLFATATFGIIFFMEMPALMAHGPTTAPAPTARGTLAEILMQ